MYVHATFICVQATIYPLFIFNQLYSVRLIYPQLPEFRSLSCLLVRPNAFSHPRRIQDESSRVPAKLQQCGLLFLYFFITIYAGNDDVLRSWGREDGCGTLVTIPLPCFFFKFYLFLFSLRNQPTRNVGVGTIKGAVWRNDGVNDKLDG